MHTQSAVSLKLFSRKAASGPCPSRLRERPLLPSSPLRSNAATAYWSVRPSASWIAYSLFLMLLRGCYATGGNTIMSRRSSVMFCTGCQSLCVLSSKSVCWSTSHFMGPRLSICAITASGRILPPPSCDSVTPIAREKRSSRKTDENPVWWSRLLGGRPQMLERSSSCPASG